MDSNVFYTGIQFIKKIDPENDLLIEIEDMGYCAVGVAYLESLLENLQVPKIVHQDDDAPKTTELDILNRKLKEAFIHRAKLSNKYHDLFTDEDRAFNCMEIVKVQAEIKRLMLSIDYFKKNGELPSMLVQQNTFQVPNNPIELMKKNESLRQSISRAKSNLKKLIAASKDTSRQQKSLQTLIENKNELERAIAAQDL